MLDKLCMVGVRWSGVIGFGVCWGVVVVVVGLDLV